MVFFQILDVYSQDQYEVHATENTKQVMLEKYVEDFDEKPSKAKEIEYKKYEMLIHLNNYFFYKKDMHLVHLI
jgi:hypothetical protein